MPKFQNAVMDALRGHYTKNSLMCGPSLLVLCHQLDLYTTPMYKLALRGWVHCVMTNNTLHNSDKLEACRTKAAEAMGFPKVAQDFVKVLLEYRHLAWDCQLKLLGCHFHIHEAGEQCTGGW